MEMDVNLMAADLSAENLIFFVSLMDLLLFLDGHLMLTRATPHGKVSHISSGGAHHTLEIKLVMYLYTDTYTHA
uniref:Uncharacterized protein n=1 Tax=Oryza brachyantha TaxID=4533 RepID=J3LX96_ORYBR